MNNPHSMTIDWQKIERNALSYLMSRYCQGIPVGELTPGRKRQVLTTLQEKYRFDDAATAGLELWEQLDPDLF